MRLAILSTRLVIFLIMLLTATISWLYVTAAESKIDVFPGSIPIVVKNVPSGLVAIADVEEVSLKIRANQRNWSLLSADSFYAQIDLGGLQEGTHVVPVMTAVSVPNVQIVERQPAQIRVRLEEEMTKEVAIRAVVQGRAAEGKSPGEPQISPNSAKAIGPKSIIASISEAQALVTLGGEEKDAQRMVRLQVLGKQGEPLPQVRFDPERVAVLIPIVQAPTVKTVGIRPVISGSPGDGFFVQSITASPAVVTISGRVSYDVVETMPINISGLTANKTFEINLSLPAGVTLLDKVDKVTVVVTVSPLPITKEVALVFNFVDLDPNLKITSIEPSAGRLTVSGLPGVLSTINSLPATISLKGLAAGTHSVSVSYQSIFLPPDIVSSNTPLPSAILVTVEKR